MKLEFCRLIAEKSSYQVSSKSVEWEPSCFMRIDGQAGGRTDMMKLIVVFRNFAIAPKNYFIFCLKQKFRFVKNNTKVLEFSSIFNKR
jgi:hypothetical protein